MHFCICTENLCPFFYRVEIEELRNFVISKIFGTGCTSKFKRWRIFFFRTTKFRSCGRACWWNEAGIFKQLNGCFLLVDWIHLPTERYPDSLTIHDGIHFMSGVPPLKNSNRRIWNRSKHPTENCYFSP